VNFALDVVVLRWFSVYCSHGLDLVQVWFIFFTVIGWEIGVAVGLQKSAAVFFQKFLMGNVAQTE